MSPSLVIALCFIYGTLEFMLWTVVVGVVMEIVTPPLLVLLHLHPHRRHLALHWHLDKTKLLYLQSEKKIHDSFSIPCYLLNFLEVLVFKYFREKKLLNKVQNSKNTFKLFF